ncbi:MAG: aminopeptidase P family protein [Ruminococcus sp.]|nr:aminopeptidase P family protein [Ruminococcus sp.]
MNGYISRIKAIADSLGENDAALITSDISITYLTGYQHSEGYVIIGKEDAFFLVDFRYAEAVQKSVKHINVVVFENYIDSINDIFKNIGAKSVIVESDAVTLSTYKNLSEKLSATIIDSPELSNKIGELRIVKTSDEVEKLRKAQQIAEEAYLEVLDFVKVGVTEKEISARLEYLMKLKGAERVAFELITVTGKKTSLPHGVPSDNAVKDGDFITFDIGAVYDGYHSDMTRTIGVGNITDEQREIYNIVFDAHLKALESVKAGVSGFDVDKTARDIITDAGYGKYFGHSTGHGVGLEIHEAPYAGQRSKDILKAGMTVTVEPGIYLPDKFGVRIEDTVLVTEDGYETFASIPKELIII